MKCEVELRKREWLTMSDAEKETFHNYTEEWEVERALKTSNRGIHWNATGSALKQAKA